MKKTLQTQVSDAFAHSPIFQGVRLNLDKVSYKQYEKGQSLLEQDGCVCIIIYGMVDVYSESADGHAIHLSSLCKSDCFGISNLFVKSELQTTLTCAEDCMIAIIYEDALLSLFTTHPLLITRFFNLYNEKIQFLIRRIEHLTMQSSRKKVVCLLLEKEKNDIVSLGGREQMAAYLGISRATLFRELSYLKKQRYIATQEDCIILLDKNELEAILLV